MRWFDQFSLPPALLCVLVSGCTVGPNYQRPHVQMPAGWVGPTTPGAGAVSATGPATRTAGAATRPANLVTWWENFSDPVLSALVQRAIEGNITLAQAASSVRQARAARRSTAAGYWPTVDTSGSYTRSGGDGGSGTSLGNTRDLYRAGLDASWEIDIFGGIRRGVEAADADVIAATEDYRDVLVTLAAEVALNYADLRGSQRQIDIAKSNVEAQKQSAGLTQDLFKAGFVSGLDVANADALVAATQSQIPLLESSERQIIYALSVLLGREPGALLEELSKPQPIPVSPPEVPLGLPSELLVRRADIRRAEAQLHSETARVGVVTADLYPRFALTGSVGQAGAKIRSLGNASANIWSFGPSVTWPLFDAGRIRANVNVQSEVAEQALLAYRATILGALQEVENALIAYAKEQERHELLQQAVVANRRAVQLATTLYKQGETDFLNVLSAQRLLYSAEDALVQSDRSLVTSIISLYKALGGGW